MAANMDVWVHHKLDSDDHAMLLVQGPYYGPFEECGPVHKMYCHFMADLCHVMAGLNHLFSYLGLTDEIGMTQQQLVLSHWARHEFLRRRLPAYLHTLTDLERAEQLSNYLSIIQHEAHILDEIKPLAARFVSLEGDEELFVQDLEQLRTFCILFNRNDPLSVFPGLVIFAMEWNDQLAMGPNVDNVADRIAQDAVLTEDVKYRFQLRHPCWNHVQKFFNGSAIRKMRISWVIGDPEKPDED